MTKTETEEAVRIARNTLGSTEPPDTETADYLARALIALAEENEALRKELRETAQVRDDVVADLLALRRLSKAGAP